jgi:hypothetical protein
MRWATRQHVRTEQAKRRSVWHRWFAWYPVVVGVEGEFDHWIWFEDLERKWSVGGYGDQKGRWKYRHPMVRAERAEGEQSLQRANLHSEQYDAARHGSTAGLE